MSLKLFVRVEKILLFPTIENVARVNFQIKQFFFCCFFLNGSLAQYTLPLFICCRYVPFAIPSTCYISNSPRPVVPCLTVRTTDICWIGPLGQKPGERQRERERDRERQRERERLYFSSSSITSLPILKTDCNGFFSRYPSPLPSKFKEQDLLFLQPLKGKGTLCETIDYPNWHQLHIPPVLPGNDGWGGGLPIVLVSLLILANLLKGGNVWISVLFYKKKTSTHFCHHSSSCSSLTSIIFLFLFGFLRRISNDGVVSFQIRRLLAFQICLLTITWLFKNNYLLSLAELWHKAGSMGHPVRIELAGNGLLI